MSLLIKDLAKLYFIHQWLLQTCWPLVHAIKKTSHFLNDFFNNYWILRNRIIRYWLLFFEDGLTFDKLPTFVIVASFVINCQKATVWNMASNIWRFLEKIWLLIKVQKYILCQHNNKNSTREVEKKFKFQIKSWKWQKERF